MEKKKRKCKSFDGFACKVAQFTGSTGAFVIAFIFVFIWAVSGPLFHFSQNWQLVINTSTTIITFLMVFLIQKSQNKDSLAIQLKLNELVAAHEFASNRLVSVEDMTEDELRAIKKYYSKLNKISIKEKKLQQLRSIDEAKEKHTESEELKEKICEIVEK
jgi:low affinity Fe/Cu permease